MDLLKRVFVRRLQLAGRLSAFPASPLSYADSACAFASCTRLGIGSLVFASNIDRCIYIGGGRAQSRVAVNPEPVPDFIINFLREESVRNRTHDIHFVFRCHPNDKAGQRYVHERLANIPRKG